MKSTRALWLTACLLFSGCASLAIINFDDLYGQSKPRERQVTELAAGKIDYWSQVKPIVDNRCVVCHGCYDAPCQLKMESIEGLERGGSKQKIYDLSRLTSAPTTRLFEDANTVGEWREKGFDSVLNERKQTPEANREASLIYKMLELKQHNPLPADKILGEEFDLSLDRSQSCPADHEFEKYARNYPLGGMPYALPGLSPAEAHIVMDWVEQGATHTPRDTLSNTELRSVQRWEQWFNADNLERQLASRYIYEHLFVNHLYFSDIARADGNYQYFKLVRSSTPPGQPIELISTRRPYDDPQIKRVYYRLQPHVETIIAKTHMPYALNQARLARWQQLFNTAEYRVKQLPDYAIDNASNPFLTFADIPVNSRYRFMLDEAQSTIMGFIKGPVCRGQVALNVINDHFWVYFVDPELVNDNLSAEFLQQNGQLLELPGRYDSNIYRPLSRWRRYAKMQSELLTQRDKFIQEHMGETQKISLDMIWDGNNNNPNAALTIVRHFDSASVLKGLKGPEPKTAWVIGYSLLERIHYLLVAGYDVYGNAGHQFVTRTYMDFLRMEGEGNFLTLLPAKDRETERSYWYRNADADVAEYVKSPAFNQAKKPDIAYTEGNKKHQLFAKLAEHLSPALKTTLPDADTNLRQLMQLENLNNLAVQQLPQMAIIQIRNKTSGRNRYYTLLRNNAHYNQTSMFSESANRAVDEDTAMVLDGIVGAYPNAFYRLTSAEINEFIEQLSEVKNAADYRHFVDRFGVRRTDLNFWKFSDALQNDYKKSQPINSGLLDYNRLENQ